MAGGSKSFKVTPTLYADWNVDTVPAWITYGITSSGFDASCNANNTGSSRYGYIDLNIPKLGSGVHNKIAVGQSYSTPAMSVSPTSYTFDGNGEAKQFTVTSNVPWDVSTNPAWISTYSFVGKDGNGSFYAYAGQNTGSYRSGNIVLKCTSYPNLYPAGKVIPVDQPQGRFLDVQYSSSSLNYTIWDADSGYCCDPTYASPLYLDIVVSGSPNSWYCQFAPDNGEFYKYPSSYSSSYNNFQVYMQSLTDYSGSLHFYWSNDNTLAKSVYFEAYYGGCV